jgi:cell wall-associated protease
MKFKLFLLAGMVFMASVLLAQGDTAPQDWFHLNPASDNVPGIDTKSTYSKLLSGKKSETVIVAVIDGGVDPMHEDLKDIMWINPGEIAGNGIDDDKNGYVDDVHGWNFIGGKDGKNIGPDALEITRLVAKYQKMFKGKDIASLSKKDKKLYDKYQEMEKEIAAEKATWEKRYQESGIPMLKGVYATLRKELGKQDFTADDLKTIESTDEEVTQAVTVLQGILARGGTVADLEKRVMDGDSQLLPRVNNYYDPNFDPRSIVGDNYADPTERYYGNPDIKGPDANHGTHVSGIIAASRNNGIGMDGIADNVRIMGVRCVPNGDERDKDVANAIRYAVDNGASVINMSFGKAYSWDKKIVDDAVKYAQKNDVLLVHAAGNDGKNNDNTDNFPNDTYDKKGWFKPKKAKTWIEVGALNHDLGENTAASFSNYGKDQVDVFAPGVAIYSTTADNEYDSYPGTSMASPMVAGVAALLRSYYPELSANQVKDIIMDSSVKSTKKVVKPGTEDEKVSFSDLSVTGGMLNSYNAVQKADKTKGKRKKKFRSKAASNAKAIEKMNKA